MGNGSVETVGTGQRPDSKTQFCEACDCDVQTGFRDRDAAVAVLDGCNCQCHETFKWMWSI